jgi:hypothetical protein
VHIQSEPFSFSFEHTRDSDDDGPGMVTPLNEKYDDLPENVHTRITLTLLNASTFDQRVQDLPNIPETVLLFLTKLNALHINIYPQAESAIETQYAPFIDLDQGVESVTTTITIAGASTKTTKEFYVTRKEVSDLPYDDARKYTNQAIVMLAFLVNEDSVPVIEQQNAFAFLHLRLAGFTVRWYLPGYMQDRSNKGMVLLMFLSLVTFNRSRLYFYENFKR